MKNSFLFITTFTALLILSCGEKTKQEQHIVVKNTMDADRSFETVSIDLASLQQSKQKGSIVIIDFETQSKLISQQVDTDGDGVMDAILFQPEIPANSEKTFEIRYSESSIALDSIPVCYSRFVPERTDDYAWENNRVAFRTYGPTAQKMAEDGVKGGTLSSGMDAWLKRVDYPIINKWYDKTTKGKGSYHEDTGEGLDNFHVGVSRGVGGVAKKVDTSYYISKNFTAWKTLSIGPIRTSFILSYADWDANGNKISEEKKISLDYGSNLSKFEVTLKGTDTISAGLTLHEKLGEIGVNQENGWISYWEPYFGSELGTGIVVANSAMTAYDHYLTTKKDESNLYIDMSAGNDKVIYYAGFGWEKSGQFTSKSEWESYLNNFAERLKNPLQVTVK